MKNSGKKQASGNPLYFFYCLAISYFLGGCAMAPATAEDIAHGDGYLDETVTPVNGSVVTTVPATSIPGPHDATLPGNVFGNPSSTPPSVSFTEPCRCAWESWSEGGGLMCAGIRCSATCDTATRGCVERRACVIAGI